MKDTCRNWHHSADGKQVWDGGLQLGSLAMPAGHLQLHGPPCPFPGSPPGLPERPPTSCQAV